MEFSQTGSVGIVGGGVVQVDLSHVIGLTGRADSSFAISASWSALALSRAFAVSSTSSRR